MSTNVKHPKNSSTITFCDQPSTETDPELRWLFEEAETEICLSSNWLGSNRGQLAGGLEYYERRADAYHRASIIVGWLERLSSTDGAVLVAAYQPRVWPARYELKLGRLCGIVPTLPSVRTAYSTAVAYGHTEAQDVVHWLDEALARNDDAQADRALRAARVPYARALAAYRATRGDRPSLVEPDP